MDLQERLEIAKGEGLKQAAEYALHQLSRSYLGSKAIEGYATNLRGRIEDPALHTEIGGLEFENPLVVAAGWDKKGWAVNGLYDLGFAGTEVGSVLLMGQPGNLKPRLWTLDKEHSVGLNALGFNSLGAEAVGRYLEAQGQIRGRIGVSIGLNKVMPHEHAAWAHAAAIPFLYKYADYFVFNPASPNTPRLGELQREDSLRACIRAMQEAMENEGGQKPLFVKLSPDISIQVFDEAIGVLVDEGATGLVLANTTADEKLKRLLGIEGRPGGVSGKNLIYRAMIIRMIYNAYEQAGDKLEIIGVGGIDSANDVLEYMVAGASLTQLVTAIRSSRGKVASDINRDILKWMHDHNVQNVKEIIGLATKRGAKYPQAV